MMLGKWLNRILSLLLIIVILFALFMVVSNAINKGETVAFGSKFMVVLSGSMSPTFDTGSLIAVKAIEFSDIKAGDIVTFKDIDGKIVTHRVTEIKNGNLVTKGDGNDSEDMTPVTADRVIGKAYFWLPYLGYLVEFIKSKTGLLLFLVVPGVILIVSQLWNIWKLLTGNEEDKKDSEQTKA